MPRPDILSYHILQHQCKMDWKCGYNPQADPGTRTNAYLHDIDGDMSDAGSLGAMDIAFLGIVPECTHEWVKDCCRVTAGDESYRPQEGKMKIKAIQQQWLWLQGFLVARAEAMQLGIEAAI